MNYEGLLRNYRIFFEGLPEPVFYKYFYPTGDNHDGLWDLFEFTRGLKKDKPSDDEDYWKFSTYKLPTTGERVNLYEKDLRELFNLVWFATGRNKYAVGVATIPSSDPAKVNRITEIVRAILHRRTDVFRDLTTNIFRIREKAQSHSSGNRSTSENIKTLGIKRPYEVNKLDYVLVIDDVLTTGSSFRAMTEFLRINGFEGKIINFAFARHYTSKVVETYLNYAHEISYEWLPDINTLKSDYPAKDEYQNNAIKISGVIYDLDQTLLDDSIRNIRFEEQATNAWCKLPYAPYRGVEELMSLPVKCAIVSNRSSQQLEKIFGHQEIYAQIKFPEWTDKIRPPIFSYAQETEEGYDGRTFTKNFYKPHPGSCELQGGVLYAIDEILKDCGLDAGRIVGLGNTYEDIIAYKAAGIDAALALWGMPEWLQHHAYGNWGADYAFSSVTQFRSWLEQNMSMPNYLELAQYYEEYDKSKACDYYEKALQYQVNIKVAAFRLALLLSKSNPNRAKELYRQAIDAGDEYAATNNLALLMEDDNPGEAIELYQRAINAGNDKLAPRNLAILIASDSPDKAVELYEYAANAGNDATLEADLKPLIAQGNESAIALYERYILVQDEKKANNLGLLLEAANEDRAIELYERAISAGDERYATYNLARILLNVDNERARELCERAIAAGDECLATNCLGLLIADEDKERALTLFERAIVAGDGRFATRNLAICIKQEDPERAVRLLEQAAKNGNNGDLASDLKELILNGVESAVQLYEEEIVDKDKTKANDLAQLVSDSDPQRAMRLYRTAILAGDERVATYYLGQLLKETQPEQAKSFFRRSITAGDKQYATASLARLIEDDEPEKAEELFRLSLDTHYDYNVENELAIVVATRDIEEAKRIFRHAIQAGDSYCAPCNLAHLLLPFAPEEAIRLYEPVFEQGEPEAALGLAFLLMNSEPARATSLLNSLSETPTLTTSLNFFLRFLAKADRVTAISACQCFIKNGVSSAEQCMPIVIFGENYDPKEEVVTLSIADGLKHGTKWNIVRYRDNRILLLAHNAVAEMPFSVDGKEANWDHSRIRDWLNSDYLSEIFHEIGIDALCKFEETGDFVACLTAEDIQMYMQNDFAQQKLSCRDEVSHKKVKWWLRPTDNGGTSSAPCVTEDGKLGWSIAFTSQGVRPAIWYQYMK